MLILASKSPRRQKLMGEDITKNFIIKTYEIDEEASYVLAPLDAVRDIAKRKGLEAFSYNPQDTILSADTIVVLGNKIIGKPKDKEDAFKILKSLSGKTHFVITGYYIINKEKEILNHVISEVIFNDLSDELIESYIQSGSPMDKAGAYGFQDNEKFPLVKEVKGSIKNVIGFPIDEIKCDLKNIGVL